MGPVAEKGAVVLVSLDDDVRSFPGGSVGAEAGDLGADEVRGVPAGLRQHERNESAGGALAVATGDSDTHLVLHQPPDHFGSLDDRNRSILGFD